MPKQPDNLAAAFAESVAHLERLARERADVVAELDATERDAAELAQAQRVAVGLVAFDRLAVQHRGASAVAGKLRDRRLTIDKQAMAVIRGHLAAWHLSASDQQAERDRLKARWQELTGGTR